MSIKSFIIILILSVVVTYGVAVVESIFRETLVAGSAGLPFNFASGTLFGEQNTNYLLLLLDFIFWFIVIWVIWKAFQKLIRK